MELIILMGLQASGKSTFSRTQFAETYEHISKDLLKSSKNKNKNQKQAERIVRAFQEKRSVVVDNTNVTMQDRLLLIDIGRSYDATIIGYYFQPDVLSSRTRNMQRTGKAQVPEKAIFITAHKFEPPSYAEGFDALYYVRIGKDSSSENPVWEIEKIPNMGIEDYNG
ncbi:MAG TPA: ATP-binding protein [Ktedonobacteraceae bacterium]|jgi:predicted kinase|nr:ATP-binding protein [Ktedonobacteraceae bacterium]